MSKVSRMHWAAAALAVAGAVAACSDSDTSAQPGTVAVADATPVAVSPPMTGGNAEPAKPALTSISYADAESVFRKGRYGDAAEFFRVYVEEHPESGQGQYMLGLSAWKSGDHGTAVRALTRAVELDDESVKARTNLARVLLEQGRPEEALPHIEKATELAPDSHEVWRVLGNVKAELGRGEEAIAAYRHALLRNEKDAWSMNNYALVLIQQGRYDEALPPLARAVELVPRSPVFQNNLGVVLERIGDLITARQAFGIAVDADSTYRKAQISLERVQSQIGDAPGEPTDLTVFARSFVEMLQAWKTSDGEHGC